MNLSAIDLNLLVVLEALLAERNVSRAAKQVGLSQPATSNALSRLRANLHDQLLVRSGSEMVLTPRAESLRVPVRRALDEIRSAFGSSPEFDPGTSERTFRVQAVDLMQAAIAYELTPKLDRIAPGITLDIREPGTQQKLQRELESGEIDLAVGAYERLQRSIHRMPLFEDRLVCLVRRNHPRIRGPLTLKAYRKERMIGTNLESFMDLPPEIERAVREATQHGSRHLLISSSVLPPLIAAHTDLIAHTMERTAAWFLPRLGLRSLPVPFDLPPIRVDLYWHRRYDSDPGHRWLREQLAEAFRAPLRPR